MQQVLLFLLFEVTLWLPSYLFSMFILTLQESTSLHLYCSSQVVPQMRDPRCMAGQTQPLDVATAKQSNVKFHSILMLTWGMQALILYNSLHKLYIHCTVIFPASLKRSSSFLMKTCYFHGLGSTLFV